MASRPRLGKGLGALFPEIPDEEHITANNLTSSEEPKSVKLDKNNAKLKKRVHEQTLSVDSQINSSSPKTISSSNDVSRETSGKKQRIHVPSLEESIHPSDMFFGTSDFSKKVSKTEDIDIVDVAEKHENDVSRETSKELSEKMSTNNSGDGETLKPVQGGYLTELDITSISPNEHQPRTVFDEDDLAELSKSIVEVGVLQPIVVRKRENWTSPYELIMGERRLRASQKAGLTTIPAIVKTTSDNNMLRDALLENLHRVALNPLEEAAAYQQMLNEFGMTQEQLSKSISKSRPQISNTLRLLQLPADIQKKLASGVLSAGHARALLGLNNEAEMSPLATRIIAEGLSVRSTEEIVAIKNGAEEKVMTSRHRENPWANYAGIQYLEDRFETKVSIKGNEKRGKIEITFSSPEDLERIVSIMNISDMKSNDSREMGVATHNDSNTFSELSEDKGWI